MSASDADRQLLLGMFAVHLGMCSPEAVCEAVSSWSDSPDAPLAGEFDVRGLLSGRQIRLIEDLVDERLSHDGPGVWQWCSRHLNPAFIQRLQLSSGESIKSRLTALAETVDQSAGQFGLSTETAAANHGSLSAEWDELSLCGGAMSRYRILRHHAQGGLGKVSVAEDVPLGREVAFKELRPDRAGDVVSRSRFVLEAKVTGRLEHPSIVPVYDVGRQAGGEPFYVMKFIHGQSLKDIIRRFHSPPASDAGARQFATAVPAGLERNVEFRGLLTRFIAVCQAVEYAHKHGVIHRDLKPANIMLGDYGETLLVDWGLAKVIGQSAGDEAMKRLTPDGPAELTMEGAAVGTPAYMSSEQAAGLGDKVTHATDIYGLGATLFSIITGRAPISGESLTDVINKVKGGAIEVHLEAASQGVPAALWAVCRKAMQTAPRDRYASAADLARDIERFLADEPVSAMREPVFARAKRWIRRHPTLVSTASAMSLMALISLAVGLSVVTGFSNQLELANDNLERTNDRLNDANSDLNEANVQLATANASEHEARITAEENLRLASDTVDTFLSGVTDDPRLYRPDLKEFRASLLKYAVPYFEVLLEQAPGDLAMEEMRGKALLRLSDIHRELQQLDLALEEIQRAAELLQGVVAQDPTNTDSLFHLAVIQNNWGLTLDALGRPTEAQPIYASALATRERILQLLPDDIDARRDQARTLTNLGTIEESCGNYAAAMAFHEQARDIRMELLNELGRNTETLYELANSHSNLALASVGVHDDDRAFREITTAVELLREHTALRREYHDGWTSLAYVLPRNQAYYHAAQRDYETALTLLDESTAIQRDLHLRYPLAPDIRYELAKILIDLAMGRKDTLRFPDAMETIQEALTHFTEIQGQLADDRSYRVELARCHFVGGQIALELGQFQQASEHLRESIETTRSLLDETPVDAFERLATRTNLTKALSARAATLSAMQDHPGAEALFLEAAEIHEQLAIEFPEDDPLRVGSQADALHNAAMEVECQYRLDEARALYERALALREALLVDYPDSEFLLSQQATTYNGLANVQSSLGDFDGCRESFLKCIELCDQLCRVNADSIDYPTTGAGAECNLANVELLLGNTEAAEERFGIAVNELEHVLERQPNLQLARRFMSITLSSRALMLESLGRYSEAVADWERGAGYVDPSNLPYYKIHEGFCRAHLMEIDAAIELVTPYASVAPEAMFYAAMTHCLAAIHSEEEAVRATHLDSAMNYLRGAEEGGYFATERGRQFLMNGADLDPLRARDDFAGLVERAGL